MRGRNTSSSGTQLYATKRNCNSLSARYVMKGARQLVLALLVKAAPLISAGGPQVAPFVSASASSIFAVDGNGPSEAISPGSGYWSSGPLRPGATVTWEGDVGARVMATGLRVSWAYTPGETKVLVSHGEGQEEATPWQRVPSADMSLTQTIMFDRPHSAEHVTLAMRSPRSWKLVGISGVELLTEPFDFMLVSSAAGTEGESCLTASAGAVALGPCLDAIATASGSDVWRMDSVGHLVHSSGLCLELANGDGSNGGHVGLGACAAGSTWQLAKDGQLQLQDQPGLCLRAAGARFGVGNCDDADASSNSFTAVAVPELGSGQASAIRDLTALVKASVARQHKLLQQLRAAAAKCHAGAHLMQSSRVLAAAGADDAEAVIAETRALLSSLRSSRSP